ncbi:MAG: hypothetical protein ABI367_02940 [Mucilaginibacter sp.]
MKPLNKIFYVIIATAYLLAGGHGFAQAPAKGDLSLGVNYFITNNQVPYVMVRVKTKVDGRFQTVAGIPMTLFLDKDSVGTTIGKVVTNEQGEATAFIPPSLKKQWNTSVKHTFLASFDGNKKYEPAKGDLTVGKAKILISTTDGKSITASVFEMKDTTWTPVKGVELKIAVKRLGGDLPVNETPTFTTDSTGTVAADFKRDTIPGDAKGNIVLIAKIEDNDQYGNLSIEKTVPWGAKFTAVNKFNERTLFATRDKAPIWLQLIAYSIMLAVWIILAYLVFNVFKIKRLGA